MINNLPSDGLGPNRDSLIETSIHRIKSFYNFAFGITEVAASRSFFARSRSSRLKIFPEGLLGIDSQNTTPPVRRLYGANRAATNSFIEISVTPGRVGTTYARGYSFESLGYLCKHKRKCFFLMRGSQKKNNPHCYSDHGRIRNVFRLQQ